MPTKVHTAFLISIHRIHLTPKCIEIPLTDPSPSSPQPRPLQRGAIPALSAKQPDLVLAALVTALQHCLEHRHHGIQEAVARLARRPSDVAVVRDRNSWAPKAGALRRGRRMGTGSGGFSFPFFARGGGGHWYAFCSG